MGSHFSLKPRVRFITGLTGNSFHANQFRLFLHSAAYVLMHTLQGKMCFIAC